MPDVPGGRLDVATLGVLGRRAVTDPLVTGWAYEPDRRSPRALVVTLDATAYPDDVEAARLDVRWFDDGDYSFHYVETRDDGTWQCRWDRHPKPDGPREHFHPPPDAGSAEPSPLDANHHLDALFAVLDRIGDRVAGLPGEA